MGQHDPLDGFVTCVQLRATAAALPGAPREPGLTDAVRDFAGLAIGIAALDPIEQAIGRSDCDPPARARIRDRLGELGAYE